MNTHLKHFLLATLIGFSVMMFFMVLNYLNGEIITIEWIKISLIIMISYTYPLYYVSAYSFNFIKRFGDKNQISTWKSVLIAFPLVIALNIITIVFFQYLLAEVIFSDININYGNNLWDRIKVPLWISISIGALFNGYNLITSYNKMQLDKRVAEKNLVTQKHEVLKTQIGPHFLFNSLNVVSGLIDENPDKAQNFIADLAQVYRYVLDQKDKEWVALSEEIAFAHTYLDLVQTRFENGLQVEIADNLESSNQMIAPLTLQLLLENCIKHNAITSGQPLKIKIYEENQHLIIQNNLNHKRKLHQRQGTGLAHIQAHYNQIDELISIVKTDDFFTVKIPLFSPKNIKMKTETHYTEQELKEAREEVKERLGFFANLLCYIIICGSFAAYNLYQGGYFWAIWPIMGWGIGVLFHGLGTFYFNKKGSSGNRWEDRQARKILEKRKRETQSD